MSGHVRSDKKTLFGAAINPPVFFGSLIVVLLSLISTTIIIGEPVEDLFRRVQANISDAAGWFFILLANLLMFFLIYLAFSKFGKIRLGGVDAKPDFSRISWFSMLFSAGLGIGLLFYGVAEPIYHFNDNPFVDNTDTIAAARSAMGITFYHYGIQAWSIYATVGLALAFFHVQSQTTPHDSKYFLSAARRQNLRTLGRLDRYHLCHRHRSRSGHLTGIRSTTGKCRFRIPFRNRLFTRSPNESSSPSLRPSLPFSLLAGLDKGIRRLSEVNMGLAMVLLVFVLATGPTAFLMDSFVQNLGYYIDNFLQNRSMDRIFCWGERRFKLAKHVGPYSTTHGGSHGHRL